LTNFGDPFAKISEDTEHSEYEQRWYLIGQSDRQHVLVVAYTERKEFIRILTARKAEMFERKQYEKTKDSFS
jgi:uncharacterized DUF497 family protein